MEGEGILPHEAGGDGIAAGELLEALLVLLGVLVGFGSADEALSDELGGSGGMAVVAAGHEGVHAGLEAVVAKEVEYGLDKDAFAVLPGAEEEEQLVFPYAAGEGVSTEGLQELFHLGITASPCLKTVLRAARRFISRPAAKGLGDHVLAVEQRVALAELSGLKVDHAVGRSAQPGI